MNKKILIGGAWPYANYKLHLGHVAGLIGGDLLARYHRANGDDVIYVSGSDCHGTPITERAKLEGISPKDICDKYHDLFVKSFDGLNFTYDLYTLTETDYHKEKVKEIIKKIYDTGAIYEKIEPQAFCEKCNKFMADRELQITCPKCGETTKGDCCDCGYAPTEEDLLNATCRECGSKTVQKDNKNLYIALSKMQGEIEEYVAKNKNTWRVNAQNETEKYLREGLKDRAITRDLTWGIDVPVEGFDDKKLYVWIEAVLGYVTAAMRICEERGLNWEDYWKTPDRMYMVHGKDNIVFHSIIFPGLLLSLNDGMHLPDVIVSSEYLNFNNEKASKSKGNAISALDAVEKLNSDTIRYHLINNGPERKDTNFSLSEYVATHNNEVTNKFGNFVNRTLKFKGISEIPEGNLDADIKALIEKAYVEVGEAIEALNFKDASEKAMKLVEDANKYYDDRKPWIQFKEDIAAFNDTIFTCATLIANISNIMEPFMPAASAKVRSIFGFEKATWNFVEAKAGIKLDNVETLFTKFDEKVVLAEFEEIAKKAAEEKKAAQAKIEAANEKEELITIDYLDKIKLKVAKVLEAEKVEGSEKLLKLKVSLGTEERQIVAGLQKYYAPEDLVGKNVVIVANLKPAKLKGIESQGMVLAAGDDIVKVITTDGDMKAGAEVC
ncbi:MAG: methionine--tRNA ligase [Clostridia bacterium]|nr:methionine--tRNA ligase [Clostridia bacterium]